MCGKTASQLLRLAMVIHNLKFSYNLLINNFEKYKVDPFNLNERIDKFMSGVLKTSINYRVIDADTVKNAFNLVSYFNKNKIAMADYDNLSFELSLFEVFDHIYQNIQTKESLNVTNDQIKLCKKVLLFNKDVDTPLKICLNGVNQKVKSDKVKPK